MSSRWWGMGGVQWAVGYRWCAIGGVQWVVCNGWSAMGGVQWVLCNRWCAIGGVPLVLSHLWWATGVVQPVARKVSCAMGGLLSQMRLRLLSISSVLECLLFFLSYITDIVHAVSSRAAVYHRV